MEYSPEIIQLLELKIDDIRIILQKFLESIDDKSKPIDIRLLIASINHLELGAGMNQLLEILEKQKLSGNGR